MVVSIPPHPQPRLIDLGNSVHTRTHIYSILVLLQRQTHTRELPRPCRSFLVVVLRQISLKQSMLLAQLLCSSKEATRKAPEGGILETWG